MKKKVESKSIEKFLQFNGKKIAILLQNGVWYIALKPICEALGVDHDWQQSRIAKHRVLSQLTAKSPIVAADGKLREMLCLPEKYIYGWIFSINSDSPGLVEYQQKCYDVLFEHFHGLVQGRVAALTQQSANDLRIIELQEKLDAKVKDSEEFKEINELKGLKKKLTRSLKEMDSDLLENQMTFSFS